MTEAIDLKSGMVFVKDGKLIKVLESNHHKPGKGNTVMQMKLYDIRSGANVTTTMRPSESYEQYELPTSSIEHELKFMLPNVPVEIEFYGDEVIGLELPGSVELKVTETQPAVKGGTVAGGGKPATLETGLVVTVPDFVKDGETIIVTTDTGTYKGRAQK